MKFSKKLVLAAILATSGGSGLFAAKQEDVGAKVVLSEEAEAQKFYQDKVEGLRYILGLYSLDELANIFKTVSLQKIGSSSHYKGNLSNAKRVESLMKALEETLFVDLKNAFVTKVLDINKQNCDFIQNKITEIANVLKKLAPSLKDTVVAWAEKQANQFSIDELTETMAAVEASKVSDVKPEVKEEPKPAAPIVVINGDGKLGALMGGAKHNPSKLNPLYWPANLISYLINYGEAMSKEDAELIAQKIAQAKANAKAESDAIEVEKAKAVEVAKAKVDAVAKKAAELEELKNSWLIEAKQIVDATMNDEDRKNALNNVSFEALTSWIKNPAAVTAALIKEVNGANKANKDNKMIVEFIKVLETISKLHVATGSVADVNGYMNFVEKNEKVAPFVKAVIAKTIIDILMES